MKSGIRQIKTDCLRGEMFYGMGKIIDAAAFE